MTEGPFEPTTRVLYREPETPGQPGVRNVFVTPDGVICMNVGGRIVGMRIEQWHELAWRDADEQDEDEEELALLQLELEETRDHIRAIRYVLRDERNSGFVKVSVATVDRVLRGEWAPPAAAEGDPW